MRTASQIKTTAPWRKLFLLVGVSLIIGLLPAVDMLKAILSTPAHLNGSAPVLSLRVAYSLVVLAQSSVLSG